MSQSKTWPGGSTGATPASYAIPDSGNLNWAALTNFLTALADGAQCTTFQKFAIRKATTSPVTVATSDCVVVTDLAVAAAVAVTMPAGANKQIIFIVDGKGDANTNNITITRAGSDTIAGSTTLVLSGAREGVMLAYNSSDTDWKIISRFNRAGTGVGGFTASRAIVSDGSGNLASATTTATEIGYVNGLTSAVQTQIDTKAAGAASSTDNAIARFDSTTGKIIQNSVVTVGDTGVIAGSSIDADTNVLTNIENADIKAAAAIAVNKLAALTASRAVVSDGSGFVSAATTTATEIGYVNGVTSALQTQIDGKQATDTDLTALAGLSSNGMIARTGSGSASVRTITGTANKVTVTDGDGVSGNPTLTVGSDIVQLTSTQTLTNKDYDGGAASNSLRLTVPKTTLATATGLTRKEGTIIYATDTDQLLADDGTSLNPIGGGAGEKNYIANSNNATNWTASGAGVTVATTVTAAELPREFTTKSGIKITGASGSTAYAYYRFSLDDADWNRKCKIKFDLKPVSGYVASDMKVDLYSNTASDYTGTSTRIATSSDSSAICAIPNATGQIQTSVDMPSSSAPYMELRIGLNATSTQAIVISDVVVGPGLQPQGAAVEEWKSYTPTGSWSTNTTYTGKYRRVGSAMEVEITLALAGAPTTATLNAITLPTGYTIDTSALSEASPAQDTYPVGVASVYDASAGADYNAATYIDTANKLAPLHYLNSSAVSITQAAPVTFASGDRVHLRARVPIAEWAGNGVVNLAQNDVEYAYNSATANSSDTTSFAYGPEGVAMGLYTAERAKRVRFKTPIQATDAIVIELQTAASMPWVQVGIGSNDANIPSLFYVNTTSYGIGYANVNATDIDVRFGTYGSLYGATTYAGAGAAWGTSVKWRVRKNASGQAVGFAKATDGSLGLINTYTGSVSSTFTFNGSGGTSSAATLRYQRLGDFVTMFVPAVSATSGTGSTTFTANTAVESFARPLTGNVTGRVPDLYNNATSQATPGFLVLGTGGILVIYRDATNTAYTNTAAGGNASNFSYTYYVGTGS